MRPSGGPGWRVGALIVGVTLAVTLVVFLPRRPVRAASEHFSYSETLTPHPGPTPSMEREAGPAVFPVEPHDASPHDPAAGPPHDPAAGPPHDPAGGPPHDPAGGPRHDPTEDSASGRPPRGMAEAGPRPPQEAAAPHRTTWVALIGVASSGAGQTAVVRIAGRTIQLRVGSTIGSWKVAALDCRPLGDSSMVVSRNGVRRQLRLVSVSAEEAAPPQVAPGAPEVASTASGPVVPETEGPRSGATPKRPLKGPMAGMAEPFPGESADTPHPVDPRDFNP